MNTPCVHTRIAIRRIERHPVVQRTLRSGVLLRKHVVRGATLSLVPDAVNDVAFHHAQLNISEVVHVFQDTIAISTMNTVLATMLVMTKLI
jgi:hypothetical protein